MDDEGEEEGEERGEEEGEEAAEDREGEALLARVRDLISSVQLD